MKYDYNVDMSTDNSLSLILRRIKRNSKVLEFGTATGYMTRYLKEELGCEVYGVEIDPGAADKASQYCKNMIVADIDQTDLWSSQLAGLSFDHVTFADVLEHLRDPRKALEKASAFLKKDGTILSSIPNIGHNAIIMEMLQGKFEYRTLGLLDETHIKLFTRKSILETLDKAGLSPVECLATYASPEETEFNQQYETFPEHVQDFLRNRENAHAYQFITVAKKKSDVSPGEYSSEISNAPKIYGNDFLQVFWEVDESFDEKCSDHLPIKYGNEFQLFEITLPNFKGNKLRIDPGNHPAHIEIKSIELKFINSNEKEATAWSHENNYNGLKSLPGIVVLDNVNSYQFFSFTDDPQLIIEGVELPNDAEAIKLQILMRAEKLIPKELATQIDVALKKKDEELYLMNNKLLKANIDLQNIKESLSWRITSPLRKFKKANRNSENR